MEKKPKVKQFELKSISQRFNGPGVVKYIDKEYEIDGLLALETGLFEVEKGAKKPLKLLKIVNQSSDRIKSLCPHHLECGGCQYQHMSYDSELKLKHAYLSDLFKGFKGITIPPVVGMPNPYNYRNKSQMTYKLSKNRNVVCGFYAEGTHNIIPVVDCKIQASKATEIINAFNRCLTKHKIEPYDEKTRRGIVRHVVVRYGFNSKEILLCIVTNGEFFPGRKNVVNDLIKMDLGITTIVQNFNARDTSIVLGDKERVLYGPGFIYDYIGKMKFKISARSFYQINTVGMQMLYKRAIELAEIKSSDIVLDTYCGIGTIGILASPQAKEVYGVELNRDAYNDALINAKINGIKNIKFINSDSTKFMVDIASNNTKIDVLIMDPPREGSTEEFINALDKLRPRRIVYVSCDPKTLKRDLYQISKVGYTVSKIEGFDMFPRTFNVETIALLELKK